MQGTPTPSPKDVESALKRLPADQFSQVCSEIGMLEVTLPGGAQAAKAAALVAMTWGRSDFTALVRAINRVNPKIWLSAPARAGFSSLILSVVSVAAILGIGGLVLALIFSGSEQAAKVVPTPTQTLAATRTPVPTFTHTPSPTSLPTRTVTPTPTARPTPVPRATPTFGPAPTATAPPPLVAIIYPKVELQRPRSGSVAHPTDTVEFRWLLRGASIARDERFLMRLYQNGIVVDSYVSSDPWRFDTVPSGRAGEFTWTVTVVKVDAANNAIGPLSPESDAWKLTVQP